MLYDLGGRGLYLESTGAGGLTVVFEAGAGRSSDTWDPIWPAVAAFARVCRYDRLNLGQSDRIPGVRTLADVVADLHALLKKAAVPGPYVLVGHSLGGLAVRLFAHCYPQEVAGVVLIDSSHPEQRQRSLAVLPPPAAGEEGAVTAARARYHDPDETLAEGINFGSGLAEVNRTGNLGGLPLAVISRSRACSPERLAQVRPGLRPGLGAALEDLWQELQADLAGLSRDSFHLIAPESGHYVHHDQPALVVEAIRRVVLAARLGGTHLQNWARGQEFGS